MKKLTATEKVEALTNGLRHYKISEKYFIYHVNLGRDMKFTIASKSETGGINTHTKFMDYKEFNAFLLGYSAGRYKTNF